MEGEEVWVQRPTSKGHNEGVIVKRTGDLSYLVHVETGGQVKRKPAEQLRIKMASEQGMLGELMHDNPARVTSLGCRCNTYRNTGG